MKKITALLVLLLASLVLSACNKNEKTIKVIATSIPHAEILEFARPLLKEGGYEIGRAHV